jgi:CRP-like cAMP-binding protein
LVQSCKIDPLERTDEDIFAIINALRAFPLFSNQEHKLSTKEKIHIAQNIYLKTYEPLEPVCRTREPSNFVFFVIEGEIAVTLNNPKKFKREDLAGAVITTYKQGSSFGEIGIISNTTRYERVTQNSELYRNAAFNPVGSDQGGFQVLHRRQDHAGKAD